MGSDRHAQLWPLSDEGDDGRRRRAAQAVREEVERRKRRLGLIDHDDWLALLRDALADPELGTVACDRVSSRYRVVMVDEFQDTDPVQWEILRRAFHGRTTLVLIGDPKQAIYAFRGGDVTTYLAAAGVADRPATLARNWRSDADLPGALDQLLGGAALGDPRIAVRPVEAAHPQSRLTDGGAPLRLRRLGRAGHGRLWQGFPKVDVLRAAVACDVAADIVDLLSGAARLGERPVEPGDIAVLVRTNAQGALVRETLGRAGVPAVLAGGGSGFATPSATSWLVLLEALAQPHRAGRVRAAALSVFLPDDEASLDAAGHDLADRLGHRLRRWADLLAQRGVAAFLEVLTAEERLPERAGPTGRRAAAHRPATRRTGAARRGAARVARPDRAGGVAPQSDRAGAGGGRRRAQPAARDRRGGGPGDDRARQQGPGVPGRLRAFRVGPVGARHAGGAPAARRRGQPGCSR